MSPRASARKTRAGRQADPPSTEPRWSASPGFVDLARDLLTFLGTFERQAIKPIAGGGIGKKVAQRIAPFLRQGDEDYAAFLGLFLGERKILFPGDERWEIGRPNLERLWGPDRLLRAIVSFWVRTPFWNESIPEPDVLSAVRREYISQDPALEARRRRLLEELRAVPPDEVFEFAPLAARFERGTTSRGRNADEAAGRLSSQDALRRMLDGPLRWLGILERSGVRDREARTDGYRVTPFGRRVLAESWDEIREALGSELSREEAQATLQPNLEALVPPDVPLQLYLGLARAADLRKVDVYTTFEITWDSVMNVLDRGVSPEDLLAFLESSSSSGLPDTVRQLVHDCAGRHGEVQVGTTSAFLEVRDPRLLRELFANRRLRPFLQRRLGDLAALLLPTADLAALRKELRKSGYSVSDEASDRIQLTASGIQLRLTTVELEEAYAAIRSFLRFLREADPDVDLSRLATLEEALGLELTRIEDSQAYERATEFEAVIERALADRMPRSDVTPSAGEVVGLDEIRNLLRSAVGSSTPVAIEYDGFQGITRRVVEPESFDGRYLVGYCRLRRDKRTFNSAKILSARPLPPEAAT